MTASMAGAAGGRDAIESHPVRGGTDKVLELRMSYLREHTANATTKRKSQR